ncbi:MAG TPA: phosphoglycerate mutase family protein [Pyrinomonadaceae bacterium]|nr:phosphoglycerate mutase family protein [Pyrinomonadaceae bacterium]
MKLFSLIALTLTIFCVSQAATAQTKTIILVRHAEKADATSQDPELSAEGKQRAERLAKVAGKYKPGAFYSTNFKRTRDTIGPLAAKRNKTVAIYDARKPAELLDQITKSKIKRHIVAGHSNSVPGLANFIGKKDVFKNLDESEYGVIWIIRMKNGQIVRTEVMPY